MDIIIFGISGDLAGKKLVPTLQKLFSDKKIPSDTRLFGFSRSIKNFENLSFTYAHVQGSYSSIEDMQKLKSILRPEAKQLFYIALPPSASRDVLGAISASKLVSKNDSKDMRLVLLEKPFGEGYEDTISLAKFINSSFSEGQCLKVDHYAGKKEIRTIVEHVPHGDVKKVYFEILDTATVENRSGFYDTVGALRDVGQNHLLLMLATFFKIFREETEGNKREDVLSHLIVDTDMSKYHFGQYSGYDKIETFFSIPVILAKSDGAHHDIDIILRSGKGLNQNHACIRIEYADGKQKEVMLSSGTSAYENIFLDAMEGNLDNFPSDKEVLLSWKFIEQVEEIKEKIKKTKGFYSYPIGSAADSIL